MDISQERVDAIVDNIVNEVTKRVREGRRGTEHVPELLGIVRMFESSFERIDRRLREIYGVE